MKMKKFFTGIILAIFNLSLFAYDFAYPFQIFFGVLDPLVSDQVSNIMSGISWTLTIFLFVYILIKWVFGIDVDNSDELSNKERKQLKEKLK